MRIDGVAVTWSMLVAAVLCVVIGWAAIVLLVSLGG